MLLTVFCVWLGWNVNRVQERKRMLELIRSRPRSDRGNIGFDVDFEPLPLSLRLFGAERQYFMPLKDGRYTRGEVQRIMKLFPEAHVVVYGGFSDESVAE